MKRNFSSKDKGIVTLEINVSGTTGDELRRILDETRKMVRRLRKAGKFLTY